MPDPSGRLTRDEMLAKFDRGETVLVDGRHILRKEDLPPEAELVAGDQGRVEAATAALDAQIAALSQQRAQIERRHQAAVRATEARAAAEKEAAEKAAADRPAPTAPAPARPAETAPAGRK
jgi:hypothetical protein